MAMLVALLAATAFVQPPFASPASMLSPRVLPAASSPAMLFGGGRSSPKTPDAKASVAKPKKGIVKPTAPAKKAMAQKAAAKKPLAPKKPLAAKKPAATIAKKPVAKKVVAPKRIVAPKKPAVDAKAAAAEKRAAATRAAAEKQAAAKRAAAERAEKAAVAKREAAAIRAAAQAAAKREAAAKQAAAKRAATERAEKAAQAKRIAQVKAETAKREAEVKRAAALADKAVASKKQAESRRQVAQRLAAQKAASRPALKPKPVAADYRSTPSSDKFSDQWSSTAPLSDLEYRKRMAGDRTFRAVRQTTTPRPTLKPVSTQSPGGNRKAKSGGGVSGPPLPLLAAGAFTIVCAIATHQATPPPPPPEETSPFVLLVGPLLCGAAVFLKGMMSPTKPDAKKAAVETPIAPEAVKAEPAAAVVTSWYDAGMRLVDEAAEEEVALKGVVVPMEAVKEEKTVDAGGRPVPTADDTLEIAKDMAKEEYKA